MKDESGEPLIGATLLWAGTDKGVITDFDGNFAISTIEVSNSLVITYVGFKTDTINIASIDASQPINVVLKQESVELETVTLTGRAASTVNSRVTAIQTTTIAGAELCKAACCNLSESFETNASVDVSYSDAAMFNFFVIMLPACAVLLKILAWNISPVHGWRVFK